MEKEEINVLCIENGVEKKVLIQLIENDDEIVKIKLLLGKITIEKEDETYFEALIKLRRDLEILNIKLLCKGCCKNVYPSGMILSMGTGRKAYTLILGKQAVKDTLVDIFDPCLADEYGTIEQQSEFFEAWIKSLRG